MQVISRINYLHIISNHWKCWYSLLFFEIAKVKVIPFIISHIKKKKKVLQQVPTHTCVGRWLDDCIQALDFKKKKKKRSCISTLNFSLDCTWSHNNDRLLHNNHQSTLKIHPDSLCKKKSSMSTRWSHHKGIQYEHHGKSATAISTYKELRFPIIYKSLGGENHTYGTNPILSTTITYI